MNHRDTQLRRHPLYVAAQVLRGSSLAAFAVAVLALLVMLLGDSQGGASRIAWIGGAIAFALSLYASRLEGQAEKAVVAELADSGSTSSVQ